MKKLLTLISPLAFMLTGCVEDVLNSAGNVGNTEISARSSGQDGDLFYYNFDEKIYLTQTLIRYS